MILKVALPTPLRHCFDYLATTEDEKKLIGTRVLVPFGRRKMIGVVVDIASESKLPKTQLKSIINVIDETPVVTSKIMALAKWAKDYYHHPIGEVIFSVLPTLLKKDTPAIIKRDLPQKKYKPEPKLALNEDQLRAVNAITSFKNKFKPFLLDGVTGSGKTEVYLEVIERFLTDDSQALVLIPEIALTPQTVKRFEKRFDVPVVVLNSRLTGRKRLDTWLAAKKGEAKIIIGTRSAIFTPLKNLSVIIVDEEHDSSFKQQEGFRYSARDLAVIRAQMESVPVVLGSATPSLESLNNALSNKYQLLELPVRAGNAIKPSFQIIDTRNKRLESGLSEQLLKYIHQHLENNNQVLLFINRRGYAPVLMCHHCGWIAKCSRCDANLTIHLHPSFLQCHHCAATRAVDKQCRACNSREALSPVGVGTEKLEVALGNHFPNTPIIRMDSDSIRKKGALEEKLDHIHTGKPQIIIGTQLLAKGHHFPDVTMVGILDADAGLLSADFRATEKVGQLLTQVSGRAGRADKKGVVYIQTLQPQNPLLIRLIRDGYNSFCHYLLEQRKQSQLPPYTYISLLKAEAINKEIPLNFLQELKEKITDLKNVELFGPIPSPMQKTRRKV